MIAFRFWIDLIANFSDLTEFCPLLRDLLTASYTLEEYATLPHSFMEVLNEIRLMTACHVTALLFPFSFFFFLPFSIITLFYVLFTSFLTRVEFVL
jgi:hypothetical protein